MYDYGVHADSVCRYSFPLTIILYLGKHHLGLSVRPGEAEGASGCGQVGGVWRELGLDSGTRLLPDPP